jgi:hypothetical protein
MEGQPAGNNSRIQNETQDAIRDFLRATASRLDDAVRGKPVEWHSSREWVRGSDGHFRERVNRTRDFFPTLSDEWLRAQPGFDALLTCMNSDPVLGAHLGGTVGTSVSGTGIGICTILRAALYAMVDEDGSILFADETFDRKWGTLDDEFSASELVRKMVAPLPSFSVPDFPVRLNQEIVLDRLTADEVTKCNEVGVLRPHSAQFPLIEARDAVGIRWERLLPKAIRKGGEGLTLPSATEEGKFGCRPVLRDDLVVNDVLAAMRLFKQTDVQSSGHLSWTNSYWFASGTCYRVIRQWPYGGVYALSTDEVARFVELWAMLEGGTDHFAFCVRRFNTAFERGSLADKIVDLVIAAEAFFLGDMEKKVRGELSYRCAVRAGKFIEHPQYSQVDVFRVMKRAYDVRSTIVHGGTLKGKDTHLPDNREADLLIFVRAVEEIVRLAIRKALSMRAQWERLRKTEYWDQLLFPSPPALDLLG